MKLYNQINRPLRWNINLTAFSCDPYGEVDVPDMFVEHCKARGLPLGVTPVASEVKAAKTLEAATSAAKNDEVLALTKQLSEATAAEKVAKEELEKLLAAEISYKSKIAGLEIENSTVKSQLAKMTEDFNALTKLTEEQAKATEALKQERDRVVATLEEYTKAKQEAKPQQQAKSK